MTLNIEGADKDPVLASRQCKISVDLPFEPTERNCFIAMSPPTRINASVSFSNVRYIFFDGDVLSSLGSQRTVEYYSYDGTLTLSTTTNSIYYMSAYDVTCITLAYTGVFNGSSVDNYSAISDGYLSYTTLSGDTQCAELAQQYFNTLPALSAHMDIEVYTHGADGNKMITAKWDNIDNIPAGMYSTSYFVVISASDKMGASPSTGSFLVDGIELSICPYNDKIYQLTWVNAFNSLTASQQSYIVDNNRDYLYVSVALCHNEDGRVVDQCEVFKVTQTGGIDDEGGLPDQGGTSDTHPNTSPRPNGDYDGSTGDIDASGTGQALAIDNIITTSYAVTEQQLNDFGDWLWTNDLSTTVFGNQVAPIENVLSCKRIPFNVATASNTNIWLGNINSGVACVLASTNHYQDIGSIQIPTPCGGTFLDEQNNVSIYLPYCGIQSIPTSICYDKSLYTVTLPNGFTKQIPKLTGRTLTVKYVYDMIYGTCAALLYMDSNLFGVYNGTCGVDIPLTASNRASNQLALQKDGGNMIAGIITSAVGGAVSGGMSGGLLGAAIGGIIGAGESALGGALRTKNNAMTQETHFTTSGGFSSQIASFMSPNVTIFVEYTDIGTIPDSYAHENGYPCNLDLNLSDLVGYTELDGAIEISNIPCLEEERVLLKQALQDGFYL